MYGMLHVYTGNGKGKTTAAIGLAIRAAGAGLKVFIGQFVKGMKYSELELLKDIDNIRIEQYGLECFIRNEPGKKDIEAARKGLDKMKSILSSGEYKLVIMDEVNIATYYNLFSVEELLNVIKGRAEEVEVVITGRKADEKMITEADLVTEMKEIKHYYNQGILAREGIEK